MKKGLDIDKALFVVTNVVEGLSHGAILRRPPGVSLTEAKAPDCVSRTVLSTRLKGTEVSWSSGVNGRPSSLRALSQFIPDTPRFTLLIAAAGGAC
jgi:hypothetical protein